MGKKWLKLVNNAKEERKVFIFSIILLSFLILVSFLCSICIGRFTISLKDVMRFIFGQPIDLLAERVILNLRIPRTLIAALIGCALGVSGTIYQGLFNNKLVSPDLLGVSSGASVGACFSILLGFSSSLVSLFSFVTGFIAVVLTLLVASIMRNKTNLVLILAGIAIGGLMSSLVGLMKYMADTEFKLAEMTYWLLGTLADVTIEDFYVIFPIVLIGCVISIVFAGKLNIVSMGIKDAKSLGVNYRLYRAIMILVATLLTSVSVAFSGTVGWVGLVIPNTIRLIFGENNKKVIPLSMLSGAVFMIIVDTLARSLSANEIPLSVITGILGTPIFIFAIFKRRREIR